MSTQRIALLQTNSSVGAIQSNASNIVAAALEAAQAGALLAISPQMALTGYPLDDLPLRKSFQELSERELVKVATELGAKAPELTLILGTLAQPVTGILTNGAAIIRNGVVELFYHKRSLPADAPMGDARVYTPGQNELIIDVAGTKVQILIGSDTADPHSLTSDAGADLVAVLEADPFSPGIVEYRLARAAELQRGFGAGPAGAVMPAVAFCNAVGGQEDLVFDGGSFVLGADGNNAAAKRFSSEVFIADLDMGSGIWHPHSPRAQPLSPIAEMYEAVTLGLRDYAGKTGFKKVVLGLSGGIDSALVAAIAADAVGAKNVIGISMPSSFSSEHSKDDAVDSAKRMGLDYRIQPIATMVDAFQEQLQLDGVAYENLQARVRGVILMAISNTEGALVLATGNRSESAMGYSTIYGDAVGGYAPIKGVPKTLVWELSWYRNKLAQQQGEVEPIPENSITKPPSAELSPGQRDDLSLPPYEELDPVLERYIADNASRTELLAEGFTAKTVDQVLRLVDRSEWKRRQYPLGPKVSEVALGRDRRLPIMNSYQETHEE